jgi:putative FmdB family regulatory protein
MPIYAYRCSTCGHAKDVLQKMSDPLLTVCPSCGASTFAKQVTAAGFQLKGSGWYVTDFKGDPSAKPADKGSGGAEPAKTDGATAAPAAEKSDAAAPAPAPAPAPSTPPVAGAK